MIEKLDDAMAEAAATLDWPKSMTIGGCAWEGADCPHDVVAVVVIEMLEKEPGSTDDSESVATARHIGYLCEEHVEFLLRLDAANPLFWTVTSVQLLR